MHLSIVTKLKAKVHFKMWAYLSTILINKEQNKNLYCAYINFNVNQTMLK